MDSSTGRCRGWVVGSINQDIVAYTARLPKPGETVLGSSSALFPGGKGSNQAVAMARLDAAVSMVGRVGRDSFGTGMVAFLRGEGVDISAVEIVDGASTGIALITVDQRSENSIVVVPGANLRWGGQLDAFKPRRGDFVVCQMEIPPGIVDDAFRQARAAGATTVFNPSPFGDAARPLVPLADILVVNEIEAAQIAGDVLQTEDADAAEKVALSLTTLGPRVAVVTLGAEGVVIAAGGATHRLPGFRVEAVDTTGAGDCFTGAFVAELLAGAEEIEAARFATQAAAYSVTRKGAAASYPTRADVAALQA